MIYKANITVRLRDMAGQENMDSEEYDLMQEASDRIELLEIELEAVKKQRTLLAMLAAREYFFPLPLDLHTAENLRDKTLRDHERQKSSEPKPCSPPTPVGA